MASKGESHKGGEVWVLAFRYQDTATAGHDYAEARDIVFTQDIDASAYRVLFAGVPYVVVLGEQPLTPSLRQRFEDACARGQPADLPPDIAGRLIQRRAEGRIPGVFWERRTL